MIAKKILIIAPYPIIKAQHGGQKRAKAMYDLYRNTFAEARFVGVFHRGQYPEWGPDDLPLGDPEIIARVDAQPYASELIAGEAIDKDIHVRSYIAKLLMEYKPDIIHLEQPFAYIGLKTLLAELNLRPLLVFGSQNIEYPLKARIARELRVAEDISDALVEQTKDLEIRLSREADLVVAVNNEDAVSHREMGAKKCIVATNGIEKTKAKKIELTYWEKYKQTNRLTTLLTFVGSGHPPNWEGFLKMIGSNTSFMPSGSRIVIAGGVGDYFKNEFKNKTKYASFWKSVDVVGKLEEERLAALIKSSDIILLPITTERGSNLKTAEAILSRKKIVATNSTFHGFESFMHLPNIYIGDAQQEFKEAIVKAIRTTYVEPTEADIQLSEKVQWEYSLESIIPAIKKALLKKVALKTALRFKHKITRHLRR